jgi:NADP-dependent 3-hydroxy acid dehydrogenase YdfG
VTTSSPADKVVGRTALVTGAGNGLGRAIAVELAARGARVLLVGRNADKLEAVREEIGDGARSAACDTSSPDDVERLATTFADEDVSILVNNAGVAGPVAPLTDIAPADWDEVFAVNVRGVYLMCRAFLPSMIGQGAGDIINLASVSGKRPLARRTPYTASKMAGRWESRLTRSPRARSMVLGWSGTSAWKARVRASLPPPLRRSSSHGRLFAAWSPRTRSRGRSWRCCTCPGCAAQTSTCLQA